MSENEVASNKPSHVVGIGASAGGLEALEKLLSEMPADLGFAFVIVQHLSPDFESLMDELLARHTPMPIHRVVDGIEVLANSVYLIPPRKEMIIADGKLLLTDRDPAPAFTLPIDMFFRSLADDFGTRAIGIVLSGTGTDGTRGVLEIKKSGGLVLVQAPASSKFDGMPRSAVGTGVADKVLDPEMMGATLQAISSASPSFSSLTLLEEEAEATPHWRILIVLRERYDIDFTLYKPGTIGRRIERRMAIGNIGSSGDYLTRLRQDGDELENLYRDLLIGVTEFFRDPQAFEILYKNVLDDMANKLSNERSLRVWTPGCATGEEAYSLAIMLHELATLKNKPLNVKIFATDLHPGALEAAGAGLYRKETLSNVSDERLERYFIAQSDNRTYRVSPELRRMVVFAPQNVTKDPPFTKIDLVSCRNLLIYLQQPIQDKILSLFHFSLNKGGVMFLGPSETAGVVESEFDVVDRHWRLYRKRRDARLTSVSRFPVSSMSPVAPMIPTGQIPMVSDSAEMPSIPPSPQSETIRLLKTYDALLDMYMPAGFLVDIRGNVIHVFGDVAPYTRSLMGRPTIDLLDIVVDALKIAVGAGIQRAAKERSLISYGGIRLGDDENGQIVTVTARRVQTSQVVDTSRPEHILLTVAPQQDPPLQVSPQGHGENIIPVEALDISVEARERIRALEYELRYTKEHLLATNEELETSNEELQATNEEMMASNEELQSTNEELHSVNEELYTVNAEYERKIAELTRLTADMDNLLQSTDLGTVFVDTEARIRKYTPAVASTFSLIPQDVGRPIDHFAHRIRDPHMMDHIRQVLETGERIEREVQNRAGDWLLMRILPYRTEEASIEGAVVTLVDVTQLKGTEEQLNQSLRDLRVSNQELQQFAHIVSHDLKAPIRHIHAHCLKMRGLIGDSNAEVAGLLDRTTTSVKHMNGLIEGLLAYSRIGAGGAEMTPTDLNSVFQTVVQQAQEEIDGADAVVVADPLPTVLGDRIQLVQLFQNLIENAIKFRAASRPRVYVAAKPRGQHWVLSVQDNGIGVDPKFAESIFEVFRRLHDSETYPGTGMGLVICRKVVDRHGGRIWLDRRGGMGSTFYFTLPMMEADFTDEAIQIEQTLDELVGSLQLENGAPAPKLGD
ncbi:PAS domain-containing protein [Litorivicinus lipolyticus]|uniref:histidine kinase n=1 Tax=Litorivicinus lipolyticus TaxID=418701 RepID=A0A5Q2Q6K3_9GAMM|nr:chemotaxis protein CheB [Litorivicinus lipolyticus]QGG79448.1 PAS domain-containing protein [Litorivicinus lipolyticus]